MDDLAQPAEPGLAGGEHPMTRSEWELAERVSELEARLEEAMRSAALREIELDSLRHELELRMAYNGHLEDLASERQKQIDWFRRHAGPIASVVELNDDDVRTQLLAERQRISYRIVQRLSRSGKVLRIVRFVGRKAARR